MLTLLPDSFPRPSVPSLKPFRIGLLHAQKRRFWCEFCSGLKLLHAESRIIIGFMLYRIAVRKHSLISLKLLHEQLDKTKIHRKTN